MPESGKMTSVVLRQHQYQGTFGCNPGEARRARKAIAAFAQTWLTGTDAADFESAIGEALANAVSHGKCKRLKVDCRFAEQAVVAEILQQNGVGFEPASILPPAAGAARGYGLFIMRSILDAVEYAENGKRVRLVKRAPPLNAAEG
jgi:anti-sigma regulatory factor (Ser/Thr protein kinase)